MPDVLATLLLSSATENIPVASRDSCLARVHRWRHLRWGSVSKFVPVYSLAWHSLYCHSYEVRILQRKKSFFYLLYLCSSIPFPFLHLSVTFPNCPQKTSRHSGGGSFIAGRRSRSVSPAQEKHVSHHEKPKKVKIYIDWCWRSSPPYNFSFSIELFWSRSRCSCIVGHNQCQCVFCTCTQRN